jgi:membrane-associated phospholipid phosphatase
LPAENYRGGNKVAGQLNSLVQVSSARRPLGGRFVDWLLFADYGPVAARNMAIAWIGVGCFALADTIWMPFTPLSFAPSNWSLMAQLGLALLASVGLCALVALRLGDDPARIARVLLASAERGELIWRAVLVVSASATAGGIFCYLATMAALPLRDPELAAIDRWLGFDWLGFVSLMNDSAGLSQALTLAYSSTGVIVVFACLWLCALKRVERLTEFLAVLSASTVGVGIGMLIAPASGAYTYFKPARALFSNYSADAGTFHMPLFTLLRTSAHPVIDFATADGIVTFPSFHTVIGVISSYALRDNKPVALVVLLLNASMIVSTLPVGGHYLIDLIAGALIALIAIAIVRWNGRSAPTTI